MSEIRILKIGSCPSISGRSTITYHIGCKGDTIHLRLIENTGRGVFNKDWIPMAEFDPLLTSEKPITAGLFRALFQGKSANTIGFVIAALIAEGLLKVSEPGSYVCMDPTEFKKRIQALMDSPQSVEDKPAKAKKTATNKTEGDK